MNSGEDVEGFVKMYCGVGGLTAEERVRTDRKGMWKRRMLVSC